MILDDNSIGQKGAEEVAKIIGKSGCLATLALAINGIRENGAKEIAAALVCNHTLVTLDLGKNGLGDKGVKVVCQSLLNNNHLKSLDLCTLPTPTRRQRNRLRRDKGHIKVSASQSHAGKAEYQ